uniref:Sperm associated antigen 8 n=1 Tax=Ictidomys tridecemlineatus TaxID=43179 RepID=A0A287CS64_ICTTR
MEPNESTEGSPSRSLDVQPCAEELGTVSEPFLSSHALASATTAADATPAPYSRFTEPSSDNFLGAVYAGTPQIGRESLGFDPDYVSSTARHPYTTTDLSSSAAPVPGFSSDPLTGSSSSPVPGPGFRGYSSFPGSSSVPDHGLVPSSGTGPGSGSSPGFLTGPGPGTIPPSGPGTILPSGPGTIPPSDLFPNYTSWNQYCHWDPQKQPPWESLQVSEPGARGLWKTREDEGKPKFLYETMPRGQCLLYNWEEERATNHLDQVPNWQDISESFFFRHGHQGLLTTQPPSPMPSSTTQKDSYQPPRNLSQPLQGKREAMVEMLLHHQICKEVQADLEPIKKPFKAESVTHHDYRMELMQGGPPAPTKPHDYRQEQPESFWIQRAPQLPGVSNIRTLDTPFRKNCSFSTPVPLSLGQPLPYELENYPHQLGEMSSLACQREGQGHPGGRMGPV